MPPVPIVFERADADALKAFNPNSKRCTMNCGPHRDDPRSKAERMLLCPECEEVSEADPSFKSFLDSLQVNQPVIEDTPTEKPPGYVVILHNNPKTPFYTVMKVLTKAFDLPKEVADKLMWHIHAQGEHGKGPVGSWTKEIAEQRVANAKAIEEADLASTVDTPSTRWPRLLEFTIEPVQP
jgi:ATP-dependent Clp protease adapter protein ClpS